MGEPGGGGQGRRHPFLQGKDAGGEGKAERKGDALRWRKAWGDHLKKHGRREPHASDVTKVGSLVDRLKDFLKKHGRKESLESNVTKLDRDILRRSLFRYRLEDLRKKHGREEPLEKSDGAEGRDSLRARSVEGGLLDAEKLLGRLPEVHGASLFHPSTVRIPLDGKRGETEVRVDVKMSREDSVGLRTFLQTEAGMSLSERCATTTAVNFGDLLIVRDVEDGRTHWSLLSELRFGFQERGGNWVVKTARGAGTGFQVEIAPRYPESSDAINRGWLRATSASLKDYTGELVAMPSWHLDHQWAANKELNEAMRRHLSSGMSLAEAQTAVYSEALAKLKGEVWKCAKLAMMAKRANSVLTFPLPGR